MAKIYAYAYSFWTTVTPNYRKDDQGPVGLKFRVIYKEYLYSLRCI